MIDDRRVIDATTRVVPKTRGSMDHDFDAGETPLKARILFIAFSPPWVSSRPNRPCTTASRQVQSPDLFLFFLASSFFLSFFLFSLPRPPVSCCPTGATNSWAARIGPALAEYWLAHRIRYKNGPGVDDIVRDRVDYLGRFLTRCYRELTLLFLTSGAQNRFGRSTRFSIAF